MYTFYAAFTIVMIVVHMAITARASKNPHDITMYQVFGSIFTALSALMAITAFIAVMNGRVDLVVAMWPFTGALVASHLIFHLFVDPHEG